MTGVFFFLFFFLPAGLVWLSSNTTANPPQSLPADASREITATASSPTQVSSVGIETRVRGAHSRAHAEEKLASVNEQE